MLLKVQVLMANEFWVCQKILDRETLLKLLGRWDYQPNKQGVWEYSKQGKSWGSVYQVFVKLVLQTVLYHFFSSFYSWIR